ncbi:hypothetical protein FHG87_005268, partial [Trinorchestia longiramus]
VSLKTSTYKSVLEGVRVSPSAPPFTAPPSPPPQCPDNDYDTIDDDDDDDDDDGTTIGYDDVDILDALDGIDDEPADANDPFSTPLPPVKPSRS